MGSRQLEVGSRKLDVVKTQPKRRCLQPQNMSNCMPASDAPHGLRGNGVMLSSPHRQEHPMDNFAMVDIHSPDVTRFPALRHARGLEAVLEPGDVLWLPRRVD